MIRGSTLLALLVVLGLACVFADIEKKQESKSSLLDTQTEEADVPESEIKGDGNVNDPKRGKKYRYRYRYRKPKKCRKRKRPCPTRSTPPPPTPPPTTTTKTTTSPNPQTQPPPCSSSRPEDFKWANEWQGKMFFECKKGHSLTYMKSVFRDCQHDRIWSFGCGYNEASKEHCHWTHGSVNDPGHGIFFNCPNHGFITGIRSEYINPAGDRRFEFKCCNDEDFDHANCHQSHHLNSPGHDLEFRVDRDKRFYITGINSYFNHEIRDRVWKIDYCKSEPEHGSGEGYALDVEEKEIDNQEQTTN